MKYTLNNDHWGTLILIALNNYNDKALVELISSGGHSLLIITYACTMMFLNNSMTN